MKSLHKQSDRNNYIGADNTSQNLIDVISLRFIPSNRFVWYYLHLSRSLGAMLLTGIVPLASRYNYCSTASRLFLASLGDNISISRLSSRKKTSI